MGKIKYIAVFTILVQILLKFSIPKVSSYKIEKESPSNEIRETDDEFLDNLERATFLFFWEQTSPSTGQIKDRSFSHGQNDTRDVASIASTGYGLSALTIGHMRNYRNQTEIKERVQTTLRFIWNDLEHEHGFFYHFVNMETGKRVWECELSSIDTAILICGVLNVREYFSDDQEIQDLATNIYQRVDYAWMMQNETTLSMGWKPETGFIDDRWNRYCELMMLVLQAIGSPTHSIPVSSWDAFKREKYTYDNMTYIMTSAPIFIHQFSHAWIDFRNLRDNYTNYFENSVTATIVHKKWCQTLTNQFPTYSDNYWGITASDTPYGYDAWGGPGSQGQMLGKIDGSLVPCAAAGSIPFLPNDTIAVLRNVKDNFPKAWDRYGFIDAFNPLIDWWNPDVIGIDLGITILMAENYRTEFIWKTFMKNKEIVQAMADVGFKAY